MKNYSDEEISTCNKESQEHRFCIESKCPYWFSDMCECMAFKEEFKEDLCECSKLLNYKGFTGNVKYSCEDERYFGNIFLHEDLVMYGGNTIEELKADFKNAVDQYIEFSHEIGKKAVPKTMTEMYDDYRIMGVNLNRDD